MLALAVFPTVSLLKSFSFTLALAQTSFSDISWMKDNHSLGGVRSSSLLWLGLLGFHLGFY
jgi:hypothetical protein